MQCSIEHKNFDVAMNLFEDWDATEKRTQQQQAQRTSRPAGSSTARLGAHKQQQQSSPPARDVGSKAPQQQRRTIQQGGGGILGSTWGKRQPLAPPTPETLQATSAAPRERSSSAKAAAAPSPSTNPFGAAGSSIPLGGGNPFNSNPFASSNPFGVSGAGAVGSTRSTARGTDFGDGSHVSCKTCVQVAL